MDNTFLITYHRRECLPCKRPTPHLNGVCFHCGGKDVQVLPPVQGKNLVGVETLLNLSSKGDGGRPLAIDTLERKISDVRIQLQLDTHPEVGTEE